MKRTRKGEIEEREKVRIRRKERRRTRYERKQSQPPKQSYVPRTFSHLPSPIQYHPFDHLIMVLNGMLLMYEGEQSKLVRGFGELWGNEVDLCPLFLIFFLDRVAWLFG